MSAKNLTIRYSPRALRPTAAWFIASSSPRVWLDEIAAWRVPHADIRLLPLPRSATDRQLVGVLVTIASTAPPHSPPSGWVRYGQTSARLYLPVEARLDPAVSDTELRDLFGGDDTYVWHPVCGLFAFDDASCVRISDVLTIDPAAPTRWGFAQPGVAISRRLVALNPTESLTIEKIFQSGQDDIGAESDDLSELPPHPGEPRQGLGAKVSRHAKKLLPTIARWLTQHVSASGAAPAWVRAIARWSEQQLANIQAGLRDARQREIERLMHLLDADPDRGLRFAIPIAGDAGRGVTRPGDRLAERPADFDASRLGGGRATDVWEISDACHSQLITKYRQLANRELHLGRHRRAAYIFGELLADYVAAANALEAGSYWREAAYLYRQRMQRPLQAAHCLERGGLWMEAIPIYEQLGQHERAGDLHVRLAQQEDACKQYRQAVNLHRAAHDVLSAARILEQKLDAVDEAIEELASGWRDSSQSHQCLRFLLRLLARHGRHDETMRWLTQLRDHPVTHQEAADLVNILAEASTTYPGRSVRAYAADCTRVLISRRLPAAAAMECRQLMSTLGRLAPEDRLLGRDCQRYLQQNYGPPHSPSTQPRRHKCSPTLVRKFKLPGKDVAWKSAISCGTSILVAGYSAGNLVVARSSWKLPDPGLRSWPLATTATHRPIILAANPVHDSSILIHPAGEQALDPEYVFHANYVCRLALRIGSMRGLSARTVAASRTTHGMTWLLESHNGCLTLVALAPHGQHLSTENLPLRNLPADPAAAPQPVPLHARGEQVYVGVDTQLLICGKCTPPEGVALPQRITALVGSALNTRTRIAATFAEGGCVMWQDALGRDIEQFASDMPSPIVCFSRHGSLIAGTHDRCEIYDTGKRRLQQTADILGTGMQPLALLPGPVASQFAIVSDTGRVAVYEIH